MRNGGHVRFVCFKLVQSQRQRIGLFQALDEARESPLAAQWALKEIGELYGWFRANLSVPGQFQRDGWKGRGQPGLSWFKPAAHEHIQRMYRLKAALESCGVNVDVLTSRDPGEIVWQDKHQIVAEPGSRRF